MMDTDTLDLHIDAIEEKSLIGIKPALTNTKNRFLLV